MRLVVSLAIVLCLTAVVSAQTIVPPACSDLTVGGNLTGGGFVQFDVTNSLPDSPTAVFVGLAASISISPTGFLAISPANRILACLGDTDPSGVYSCTVNIPNVPPSLSGLTINAVAQAVTVDLSGISVTPGVISVAAICLSDMESFTVTL